MNYAQFELEINKKKYDGKKAQRRNGRAERK
jgi:hypothetical protein